MRRKLTRVAVATVFAVLVFAGGSPAWAGTFTVNTTADDTDADWCSGDCTLREALLESNSTTADDVVSFAPDVRGEIVLTSALPDLGNVEVRGPGARELTVRRSSAAGTPEFRIFTVAQGRTAKISGLTVSGGRINNALDNGGGGISNGRDSTLTVDSTTVSGNFSDGVSGGVGGGIFNSQSGTLTVKDSTVSDNFAAFGGGGIMGYPSSTTNVVASTLSDNWGSSFGGGIYLLYATGNVTGSTVWRNQALSGGISIDGASGQTTTITGSTITGNGRRFSTGDVDGVSYQEFGPEDPGLIVRGSIIAGNIGEKPDLRGRLAPASRFNLIGGTASEAGLETDETGRAVLKDNGGPTRTVALLPGSPAVDGSAAFGSDTDQRGVARPQDDLGLRNAGDGSDIGAVELLPHISVSGEPVVSEGNAGGGVNAVFTVRLTGATESVSVDYATEDDAATSPEDYAASSGTLTFDLGQTKKTVAVPINGDTLDEFSENFFLNLSNPQGAGASLSGGPAAVIIRDDDDPPSLSVGDAGVSAGRSGSTASFEVSLSAPSGKAISTDYATADGTAAAGSDYEQTSGTLSFFPGGATTKTVTVPVAANAPGEIQENFFLNLPQTSNATVADDRGEGIINDGLAPSVVRPSPTGGNVSPAANVTATFSEAMARSTLNKATFKLVKKGTKTPVAASVTVSANGRTVVLNPTRNLAKGATYTATITRGAKDLAGNPLAKNKVWSFTVRR